MASTEKLFVTPMYNSLLIDQSMSLNRRRDDEGDVKTEDLNLNPDEHENEVRVGDPLALMLVIPLKQVYHKLKAIRRIY